MSAARDRAITEETSEGQQDFACNRSPTSNVEVPDQWLAATLEEYKSLRVEIIDAIQAGRQIMQVGITGISVLVGLGLQRISPFLAVLLLMILVPVLAIFITAGALGEFFRAVRASSYLAYREKIINRFILGPESEHVPAQEWERWLRRNPEHVVRDWAQFLAVFAINTSALIAGFYTIFTTDFHADQPAPLVFILGVVASILWAINPILFVYLLRRVRRQFAKEELSAVQD